MDEFVKDFATMKDEAGRPYISSGQQSLMVSILSAGTVFGINKQVQTMLALGAN